MKLKTLELYLLLLLSSVHVVDARTHDDQLKLERKSSGITAEEDTIDADWDDRTAEYDNDCQRSFVATRDHHAHFRYVRHLVSQLPVWCMSLVRTENVNMAKERDTIEAMPEDVDER